MSFKHRAFVESLVKMGKARPEYVPALKALTKCYLINEGIDRDIVAACTGRRPLVESAGAAPRKGRCVTTWPYWRAFPTWDIRN